VSRLVGLDNARATLLLLGVIFHASVFVYLYQEPASLGEFLTVVFTYQLLHAFRMPAFFVIAGFFAAYLLQSRGRLKFMKHRLMRIALPLVIFWLPLTFANSWTSQGAWLTQRSTFEVLPVDFGHLWFLYFLVIFSVVLWTLAKPLQLLLTRPISPSLFTLMLIAILPLIPGVFDKEGTLATSTQLIAEPGPLILYFLIFISGSIAYFQQDRWLSFFKKRAILLTAVFLVSFGVFFVIQDWGIPASGWIYSTAVVSGTYAAIGLFLRFALEQNRALKFVSDASYWIYLIHLPFVFFFLITFSIAGVAVAANILLTSLLTFGIGLVTYKLLVRHTPISLLLNGIIHPVRPRP
jgi:glucans biosynthesis protein C